MPHKGKLPSEKKVELVRAYLAGELCPSEIEQKYGIKRHRLSEWKRLYETRGVDGLIPSERWRKYTPEIKKEAVMAYESGRGSMRNICRQYDISSDAVLRKWIKRYNDHEGFKQPNSGGAIYMVNSRKTTLEERIEIVSYCIANNKDYGKAIERYHVSYQQIYGWVRKYERDGPEGLADHRGKSKDEARLSEVEKLRAQLKLKEAENRRLQMENDLLKKLEALERGRGVD